MHLSESIFKMDHIMQSSVGLKSMEMLAMAFMLPRHPHDK